MILMRSLASKVYLAATTDDREERQSAGNYQRFARKTSNHSKSSRRSRLLLFEVGYGFLAA